jgi:hypothetical protein
MRDDPLTDVRAACEILWDERRAAAVAALLLLVLVLS